MKKKIGRNEPCPCGSGKKFKKCCESKMIGKKYMAHKIEKVDNTSNKISSLSTIIPPSVPQPKPVITSSEPQPKPIEEKPKDAKPIKKAVKKVTKTVKKTIKKKTTPENS
jgi:SEC-C motif